MDDMRKNHGFSLPEVLISLVLISSTSMALLKQLLQVNQQVMHQHQLEETLLQSNNTSEHLWIR
jgi:prepilin-type N-terminal cleavage/methylation domain-containing protein